MTRFKVYDVVAVLPVLGRPQNAEPLIDSLRLAETPAAGYQDSWATVRPLFVCSPDDDAQIAACERTGADVLVASWPVGPGDYAKKINLGYRSSPEPWIFTGADDLRFQPGWAQTALILGDATDACVVGTNDLGNAMVVQGKHSTHSLVRRSYADESGTIDEAGLIYHEGYDHQWCDVELVATAVARGCFAFAKDAVVEHMHPLWRKGSDDETYRRGQEGRLADVRLFNSRRHLWQAR